MIIRKCHCRLSMIVMIDVDVWAEALMDVVVLPSFGGHAALSHDVMVDV